MTQIKPALTAEEWETLERDEFFHTHGGAARCLYGQPFGFTREDVELARGMAEYLLNGSYKRLSAIGITTFNIDPANALNALADRIEALLPPEP